MTGTYPGDGTCFHYEDRALSGIEPVGKPGSWSVEEAVKHLRMQLRTGTSVIGTSDREDIVTWIRRDLDDEPSPSWKIDPNDLYDRVAASGQGEEMFRSGKDALDSVGYGELADHVDTWATDRFVGIGCPWLVRMPGAGERVLDLGCGSGVDLAIALDAVGPEGTALGIDCRAQLLAPAASLLPDGRFALAEASACPVPSAWATTVVANGLPPLLRIDLAGPVITEAARVLVPEGWLQATVLVTGTDLPLEQVSDLEIVNSWRFGKPLCSQYRLLLADAGFEQISLQLAPSPFIAGFRAGSVHAAVVGARRR